MTQTDQTPRTSHARPERPAPNSEAIEDYAKAIYALQRRAKGAVGTSELAKRLGVTPASATAMLKRLDGLGLVRHEPYHGVELTAAGEREALEVMARGVAHTVTVEAAVDWDEPEHLAYLLAALDACPESLGPPVGSHVRRRVIAVTLTVKAPTGKAARETATRLLIDEMVKLGLV
jgi:DNA-binding MarR family transcriptional regulator